MGQRQRWIVAEREGVQGRLTDAVLAVALANRYDTVARQASDPRVSLPAIGIQLNGLAGTVQDGVVTSGAERKRRQAFASLPLS